MTCSKFISALTLLFIFQINTLTAQKNFTVGGVSVPRTLEFKNKEIQLNGVGQRSKMFTELYVQALYLSQLSQDAKFILESNTEMAIRIQVTSSMVTSKKLSKALEKGLEKSVGVEGITKLNKQIAQLEALLTKEETNEGDAFNLMYSPVDSAISIYKNGNYEGKIEGFEFKKAFFGIWLSENPVDKTLKEDLLGIYK
ncbi:chalcone isomerase family protein [Flavobacterium agrisoli]|uniref:Chalcone isomerase family protein n=1 Tax=Flavobacterium agrisoli TaxID=2793066 RepID=A0A934UK05_9FLAO|nr:chalcone isomerase family protein [Flavobacterium agrisoli]MBK0370546.1 chalcone isomerase family protein [Flavobacterium agrisoli]